MNTPAASPSLSHRSNEARRLEGLRIKGRFHDGQWTITVYDREHESYAASPDLGHALEEAVIDIEGQRGKALGS